MLCWETRIISHRVLNYSTPLFQFDRGGWTSIHEGRGRRDSPTRATTVKHAAVIHTPRNEIRKDWSRACTEAPMISGVIPGIFARPAEF